MSGKIFSFHSGGELRELTQSHYSDENFFQELIEKYPAILAGDQINPDNPRQFVLISREMGVPSEQDGGAHWFLDHLFIDQDAIPTFVEVKRSTDTRIRREVVAQMLDYAANATQYWPIDLIQENYEKHSLGSNATSLADIGISPESEDSFWQSVSANFRSGRVRLIFAADMIPSSLQRIIEFLNGQMVDTEVLGLEIKQFCSPDGLTTLVPHLVGRTSDAVQTKRRESRKWDEDSFIEQAAELGGENNAVLCKKLLKAFEYLNCYIWWGEGKEWGSFVPEYVGKQRHLLCSIYNLRKKSVVEIYFQHMKQPFTTMEYRQKLKTSFERIPGVSIPDDRIDKRPNFDVQLLSEDISFDLFMETMATYIEDIRASEK